MKDSVHITFDGIKSAEVVKSKMRQFMSVDGKFRANVKIPGDVFILVDTMKRRRHIITDETTRKSVLKIASGEYSVDEYCVVDDKGSVIWCGRYKSHGDEFISSAGSASELWRCLRINYD